MSANPRIVVDAYTPLHLPVVPRKAVSTVKFGVIGYGYWGPNVVRNLQSITDAEVVAVCDKSSTSRRRVHKNSPGIYVTADAMELVSSPEIDAVAVITPVWTHFELAKAAAVHNIVHRGPCSPANRLPSRYAPASVSTRNGRLSSRSRVPMTRLTMENSTAIHSRALEEATPAATSRPRCD